MRHPLAATAATLALTAAAPALAADPESGSVSFAAPEVKWSGVSTGGFVTTFSQIFINAAGEQQPCAAPSCDTFTLEVKDSADLNVEVESASTITYLQVEKPDGTVVYNDGIEVEGEEDDPVTKLKIKKAPVGTYLVQAAVNSPAEEPYTGRATLVTPPPAVAPVAPPVAAPPTAARPAPATLSAKAGRLSARKLAKSRKLPLTLSTTAPVTGVRVVLASRGKAVATGKLASLSGSKRFTLKLRRKLEPGRYALVLEAAGAAGTKTTLKVRR